MEWPKSTNLGTALMKLIHQGEETKLFVDNYIKWFIENESEQVEKRIAVPFERSDDPEKEFLRFAYRYTILRERFFDDRIEDAIHRGYQQVLLLGSGYDTRALRLSSIRANNISVIEVDTPATIDRKRCILETKMGALPDHLTFVPLDFSRDDLATAFREHVRDDLKTICVWQGVSYYLTSETVSSVLDAIVAFTQSGTLLGFDCCTPLMLETNEEIPGIDFNIKRLEEIGEPYRFGIYESKMVTLLQEKGYRTQLISTQAEIEVEYLRETTLPNKMWYVVMAENAKSSA